MITTIFERKWRATSLDEYRETLKVPGAGCIVADVCILDDCEGVVNYVADAHWIFNPEAPVDFDRLTEKQKDAIEEQLSGITREITLNWSYA